MQQHREPIVEMHGITVSFPGVKALDSVDLRLFPGEVHTLMGENGAGKSTLIKALTGVYRVDSGSLRVDGREVRLTGTAAAQAAGISTVYQEVNLCDNLSIGENVMLGQEPRNALGIDWRTLHARASEALDALGLGALDTRQPLSSLSLAVQQLVAISRAMVGRAKVLILDEPTSSLDASEVDRLFGVMRELRDRGVAILFVSHFLEQVFAISDRLTVLRNGRHEGEFAIDAIDRGTLIAKMIGKDAGALASIAQRREATEREVDSEPVLAAHGIARRGAIEPVDLELHKGEVVGFAGLLGSGRTELARLLYGADRLDAGRIEVHGRAVTLSSPAKALAHRIAFSSENRRDEGIVRDLTVRENMVLAVQAKRGWLRRLPRRQQAAIVDRYMTAFDVRPAQPERIIRTLSGGNQQKVLLGRWLATDPEVVILDEPTRGIDVGAKADIQAAVLELAARGVCVVFISSELEEVVRLSDRIVVLKDRRVIAELHNGPDVTAETIVALIAREDGDVQRREEAA
ncbi:MAG: sugar ABC transporter ATP-binding protein [Actinomycetota bacterium]